MYDKDDDYREEQLNRILRNKALNKITNLKEEEAKKDKKPKPIKFSKEKDHEENVKEAEQLRVKNSSSELFERKVNKKVNRGINKKDHPF